MSRAGVTRRRPRAIPNLARRLAPHGPEPADRGDLAIRRTERLFAISEQLRASRGAVTAQQLADRFGVSIRTIYRDLDSLRDAHFPLLADSGPGGGYALDPSYRLPPINFTTREAALLLSAAEWLERHRLLPFVDTLGQAAAKVRAALPAESLRQLQPLVDSLSFVGVPSRPVRAEVRRVIEQAWYEGRAVRVIYDGHSYIRSERTLRIRNVVVDRSEVLLNCDDLDKGEPRQFRLHRIAEAWLVSTSTDP